MIRLVLIVAVLFGLFVGLQNYVPTAFQQSFMVPVIKQQLSYAWAGLIVAGVFCLLKLKVA